jgi:hypothetical protein
MRKASAIVLASLLFFVISCKKKVEFTPPEDKTISDKELTPGLPENSQSISAFLFIRDAHYLGLSTQYMENREGIIYVSFADPDRDLLIGYDKLLNGPPDKRCGNVDVGELLFTNYQISVREDTSRRNFYYYKTIPSYTPHGVPAWSFHGNREFPATKMFFTNGFPEFVVNREPLPVKLGSDTIVYIKDILKNYDLLEVLMLGSAGNYSSRIMQSSDTTVTIKGAAGNIHSGIGFDAVKYYHMVKNSKTYVFAFNAFLFLPYQWVY